MSATAPYRGSATLSSLAGQWETENPRAGCFSASEPQVNGPLANETAGTDAGEDPLSKAGKGLITSWTDSQELRFPPTVHRCGQLLGRGRQGTVWLCEDMHRSGEYYAVKTIEVPSLAAVPVHQVIQKLRNLPGNKLNPPPVTTPKSIVLDASFLEEGRLWQQLCHPGLVQFYGVETDVGTGGTAVCRVYLEYMSGGSLLSFVRQHYEAGRLRERALRWFLNPIVEGLAYLHANDVAHLDVKAENILVTWGDARAGDCGDSQVNAQPRFPAAKLGDFGCARFLGTRAPSTAANDRSKFNEQGLAQLAGEVLSGTPGFMAPEVILQLHTTSDRCGTAADVWSLGCTILQLLRGAPPTHAGSNPAAILFETATRPEKIWRFIPRVGRDSDACGARKSISPRKFREGVVVSATLRDLLLQCLQPDPRKRSTAAQLLQHPFFKQPCSAADAAEGLLDPSLFSGHDSRCGLRNEPLLSGTAGSTTSTLFDGLSSSEAGNEGADDDADDDAMVDI
ncbi:protein kinase [Trypanosoma conorhini]|uniref:Protein kinase n=1 Tax=Trypanosoma conorhini TaxID=83891 RepID=A0A3R7MXV3_9TRYP|nr:protein kinase [Trypanosoma conorhini]RNE96962.1 protein kinase [Trypanosoma conorhini]